MSCRYIEGCNGCACQVMPMPPCSHCTEDHDNVDSNPRCEKCGDINYEGGEITNSLQQQNQKLTAALELARGDKGLGFYSDKGNWQLEMDRGFRQFTSMWPSDRTGNSERSFGGKHARQTEQEIKKILGESE